MPVTIPGERPDSIALLDPDRFQGARKLPRTASTVGPGVAMNVALDPTRNHLNVPVVPRSMPQDRRDQKRHRHHLSKHLCPLTINLIFSEALFSLAIKLNAITVSRSPFDPTTL